jgi:hypothetical protein
MENDSGVLKFAQLFTEAVAKVIPWHFDARKEMGKGLKAIKNFVYEVSGVSPRILNAFDDAEETLTASEAELRKEPKLAKILKLSEIARKPTLKPAPVRGPFGPAPGC